ncbi:hypothetical protein [Enterococcus phage vB_Efs8_KEN04]|nr:MAG TPA: hypothetical protein [Herelleviridae sp.]
MLVAIATLFTSFLYHSIVNIACLLKNRTQLGALFIL